MQCTDSFSRACELARHVSTRHRASRRGGPGERPFAGTHAFEATEYPSDAGLAAEDEQPEAAEAGAEAAAGLLPCSVAELSRARLMELYANGNAGSGLSDADMSTVLSIMRDALAAGLDVSELFVSTDSLVAELARLSKDSPELLWYAAQVSAPSFPDLAPVKLLYRKLDAVVQHFVASNDIVWGAWKPATTNGGDRLYDHPCSALWMEAVHRYLRERASHLSALPVQFWSDKGSLTEHGRVSYHPLNMVFLSGSWSSTCAQWPLAQVAFLPILSRGSYPTLSDEEWSLYQAEVLHGSMGRVLFPTLDIGELRNCITCLDASGEEKHVLLIAHSWAADFEEQLMMGALIGQTMCCMCDIVKHEVFSKPGDRRPRPRSEEWMLANLRDMHAGSKAQFNRIRKHSRLQGVRPIILEIYQRGITKRLVDRGLLPSWVVPASLVPFDMLHVFDEGEFKYYVQCCITHHLDRVYGKPIGVWLTDTLALRCKLLIRSAYVENVRWPSDWGRVFRGGKKALPCSGLQGGEMRALLQILPLVMPGILGKGSAGNWKASIAEEDYLTHFFVCVVQHYYELRRYNRPAGGHSERTLEMLEHAASNVTHLLENRFAEDQKSGFKLPKTHAGYGAHVGDLIRLLGSPRRFMSEFGEASVKTGHAAYEGTHEQAALHRNGADGHHSYLPCGVHRALELAWRVGEACRAGFETDSQAEGSRQLAQLSSTETNCLSPAQRFRQLRRRAGAARPAWHARICVAAARIL